MKHRYSLARCFHLGAGVLFLLLLTAPGAWAQLSKIYYTQGSSTATLDAAKAVNPDGSGGATLASAAASFSQPTDIVLDKANGFIYVADQYVGTGGILRFTTAGTGRTVIVPPTAGATYNGLALDAANNRLFFTQGSATNSALDALKLVNLSTLSVTTLASGPASFSQPTDLVLDAAGSLLYVADQFTGTGAILRFTTAGASRTVIVPATANADYNGLALDVAGNRLFFTQGSATATLDALKVVSLSTGFTVTPLASGAVNFTQPTDLAYDALGGQVYVTDQFVGTGAILRYSSTGTGRTVVVPATAGATYNGLVLDSNSAPVVTTSGGTTAFVEGNNVTSTAVAIDAALTLTDDNATLASATVSITGNYQSAEDVLAFTNVAMGNIAPASNSGGVLTLTSAGATATVAQWQAALRAVTYTNSSNTPNTTPRTVSFAVNDGALGSNVATKNVSVTAVNDAPVVTTSGGNTAFTQSLPGPSTPVAIDAALTVTDLDNATLASATVSITGNYQSAEDVLAFTNVAMGNIAPASNSGGVLTLTSAGATATVAQWQAALRAVTYTNSSNTPNTTPRTVSFAVNDGALGSNVATKNVSVTAVNDAPVVTTSGGNTAFTQSLPGPSTPVAIDAALTVTDLDNATLASATVSITGNYQSAEDVLAFTNVAMGNIAIASNTAGVLTLTSAGATATVAQWQAALRAVTYTNTAAAPNISNRTISFAANDGTTASNVATKTVTLARAAVTVASVAVPVNGTYRTGQNLDFTVTFTAAVTVNAAGGTPTLLLTLDTGGSVAATYLSGSGTSALIFRYTVVSGNLDATGIALGTALLANGGTIRDAAAQDAVLTLNGVGPTAGVLVDGVAPTLTSINRQTPAAALTNATTLVYRVTFSEAVNGVGPTDFALMATGTATGSIAFATLVSSGVYDVTVNPVSGNGTLRLDLNSSGTGITDVPGNAIVGGFTTGQSYTLDTSAPTVAITSTASNPTSTSPIPVTVTFSENVTGFSASGVAVTNGTLSGFTAVSGTVYTFSITPAGTGLVTVNVAASVAQDAATNDNTAAPQLSIQYNAPITQVVWNGSVSTDWFTAGNWTGGVPTATLDALVPAGMPRYPSIASGSATAKILTLNTGGTISQTGGTLDLKGDFVTNGSYSATGGTLALTGAASQAVGGSSPATLWNLSVGAAGATLSGPATLARVLTLTGNLATGGQPFTLLSDATGTALVVNTTGVVLGNATVQRYIDPSLNAGLGYRHYSAPVSNSIVADLTTAGFSPVVNPTYNTSATPALETPFPTVYGYDQSRLTLTSSLGAFDKGFFSPAALSSGLTVGRGYTVNIGASQLVDFVGTLNNGDLTLPLARNAGATATDAGWQLLGNPYPAPLDASAINLADRPNLDASIYVFSSTAQYAGQYRSYVNGIGGNPVVPVGQGFFARVSPGQTSGSVTFRNSQRLTSPDATPFQRGAAETRPLLQLTLRGATGTTASDDTYVYFQAGATAGIDPQYDAVKLPNSTGLNLASIAMGTQLAINGLPVGSTTTVTVPLFIGLPATGTYTLNAAQVLNFTTGAQPFLRDLQLNTLTDLSQQPTYAFTQNAFSTAPRFEVVFGPQQVLGTASAALAGQVAVFPNPAHAAVSVELPAALSHQAVTAALVDALGRVVLTQQLAAGRSTHTLPLTNVAAGEYSLRLQTAAGVVVKKLVVE
ncbi:Ig-like domain-containing protein [Hymenobacter terricola]|uniref:Ig-like domain-containing protein n=1 Tax=Hymenobacter terricola TaxID=2819236 RepID=UPI001CF2217B|nr:Ig-like domain-containing protein [Hymenobacter terricola]